MFQSLSLLAAGLCKTLIVFSAVTLSAVASQPTEPAGSLHLRLMVSGGEQRQIYRDLIERFEAAYPHIDVQHEEYEQEHYKANMEAWLQDPAGTADVMFYFAGHLMADFYRRGLVRPIDDLWRSQDWDNAFPGSIRKIVTHDDRPMGLPISYYHWGIYYRKSLFQRLGLSQPETWSELLKVGEVLKAEGITPFALGSQAGWPAAAWFDYLNLRINGLEFHQNLLAGNEYFDDSRVGDVLTAWQKLADRDFFLQGHSQKSWRSALPYFYQNQAAMMLMGGFVVPQFPEQVVDDIGVFPFPVIDPGQPVSEEAPTDLLFIPARARNVSEAETFLRFVARPDTQSWLNHRLGTISPSRQAPAIREPLITQGQAILQGASGYSQFFDREMPRAASEPAMDTFVRFLDGELSVENTLTTLRDIGDRSLR